MLYLLIFFSCFALTLYATPYIIEQLTKLEVIDRPGERKLHSTPVPRMGGIIIYVVSVLSFFCYSEDLYSTKMIVLCSCLLVFCGVYDDMKGLGWRPKFVIQAVTAVGMIAFLRLYVQHIVLFGIVLPDIIGYAILLLFIIGVMNSINLMDGMDGLLSGYAILVFLALFVFAYMYSNGVLLILTIGLAGSLLGFFKYNYHPAKIFLGDTGSLTIGFFLVLSSILLSLTANSGTLDLTFCIILLGLPIIDTLKVILIRILNKRNPFLPDKIHLHHIIFGAKVRYKTTVFVIYSITLFFIASAFYYLKFSHWEGIVIFALFAMLLLAVKFLIRKLRDSFAHRVYARFRDSVPSLVIKLYKQYYVPVAVVLLTLLFVFMIPGQAIAKHGYMLLLLIACISLFLVFLYQQTKSPKYNELFVMLNVVVFFGLTDFSNPLFMDFHISYQIMKIIIIAALSSLILLILLFLLVREKIFGVQNKFFSKYDIIFLFAVSLAVVLQNYFVYPKFYSVSGKLILGFIAYLSYKIITYFDKRFSKVFFYMTFLLTLITFVFIYVG